MNLFAQIGSHSTFEEAFRLLAALEQAQKPADPASPVPQDTGMEDQDDDLASLRVKLTHIQRDFTLLNSLVDKIYEQNGRQNLPALKAGATAAATNYRNAYDMTTFYTKEWFSRLFFSLDDKIDFAAHLLEIVKPFAVQNVTAWQMMVDNNPDMLDYISNPHPDT